MARLEGNLTPATLTITTECGQWEFPNDEAHQNKKGLIVFLRSWCDPDTGTPRFTYQQIADALGYHDRRDVNNYWREFEASGRQLLPFLQRKRKVDASVVEAVKAEVSQDILASAPTLCDRVSQRLGRTDLTAANIRTALEAVPCPVVRQRLRAEWEAGAWHPKEARLLEDIMGELSEGTSSGNTQVMKRLQEVGTAVSDDDLEEVVQEQQQDAVEPLFTPHCSVGALPVKMRLMVVALTLYFWNVPLSRIAQWLGISKSTAYNWVIGLAVALFPVIQVWITEGVKGVRVAIDEKWLKIKGCWFFWFAAVDDETGLPLLHRLLPTQTTWSCCWFLVLLKQMGKVPHVIITDGLASYVSVIAHVFQTTKHLTCLFHHQHGVATWLKRHLPDSPAETVAVLKRKMKRVVQTCDPRTVTRRLQALETQEAQEGWGLTSWIESVRAKLGRLRPALRRNSYPRTTNQIERFFRAFQRFYKTRGGFHSIISAKRELMLFVVVYVFTQQADSGTAPIEQIVPQAKDMPLYQLINYPFRYGLANVCLPN